MLHALILVAGLSAVQAQHFSAELPKIFNLAGQPADPFSTLSRAQVFLFVRSDCPITKRYAPELRRISQEFGAQDVHFWLVFPDRTETPANIHLFLDQYQFPGTLILDSGHVLVRRARAAIAPEAAVFDNRGNLKYHGRIDDLYVNIGKARQAAQVHDLADAITAVLSGKPVKEPETRAIGCSLADVE